MGRWKRGKKQNRGNQDGKRPKLEGKPGTWTKVKKENKAFEDFYKGQDIVPSEEWEEFMETLKRDLPCTFRITGSKSDAEDLSQRFKDLILKMEADDDEEIRNNAPASIKWYPNQLAWETKAAKRTLRKSPLYEDFHNFLVEETNCGAISRQEAVSMIPPLLLDVKSHHNVLDMCAAPGSKTTQLIEMMQEGAVNGIPSGILIANDSDNKRCYMLVHQSKRLTTPGCIVTNHDARVFPTLQVNDKSTATVTPLKFDRILCDVPCSGDGTLRKNPLLWKKWKPGLGYPLHRMQLRILHRGLEMLKVGGRVVYSTCSMNPIEDEAVIASILKRCKGSVRLVDMSGELPELRRRDGLYSWKVYSKSGKAYASYEEVAKSPVEYYRESMFCPSLEEAKELRLERCMRVLPHLQDTGGFFIAVLEKVEKLPWRSNTGKDEKRIHNEDAEVQELREDGPAENIDELPPLDISNDQDSTEVLGEDQQEDTIEPAGSNEESINEVSQDETGVESLENKDVDKGQDESKTDGLSGYKEDPYIFLEDNDEDVLTIKEHYCMDASFPGNQLLVRTAEGKRRHIYVVSEMVKDIVETNIAKLKVINTGIKAFSRLGLKVSQEIGCDFRLTQEGLHVMRNFIKAKIVRISRQDLQLLLTEEEPFITGLDEKSQSAVNDCTAGCVVWHYSPEAESDTGSYTHVTSSLWLCGHKGKSSVRCMLSKQERLHYMRIVGISKNSEELKKTSEVVLNSVKGTETQTNDIGNKDQEVEETISQAED